ncbi:PfkB family carbohydrate kinase, partial [Lactiplantibacillus pentosus]
NPAPANKDLDINHVTKVDFFSPNETELATLTGMPTNDMDEIKKAAHHMIKLGVKNMLITLGSKGVLLVNESTSQLIKAIKVNAVDTTGAGDSFIGSFAHYYASGDDIPTAIKHANQYAAVTVTRRGTQKSYPTADELSLLVK